MKAGERLSNDSSSWLKTIWFNAQSNTKKREKHSTFRLINASALFWNDLIFLILRYVFHFLLNSFFAHSSHSRLFSFFHHFFSIFVSFFNLFWNNLNFLQLFSIFHIFFYVFLRTTFCFVLEIRKTHNKFIRLCFVWKVPWNHKLKLKLMCNGKNHMNSLNSFNFICSHSFPQLRKIITEPNRFKTLRLRTVVKMNE